MKFHEALRQIVRLNGREVMDEGRRSLIGFLRKHHAFDDLPVIEDAMAYFLFPTSGGADGYAARLTRLSRLPDRRQYFAEAEKAKKSLAEERHFSRALADYAVDSVSYALDVNYSPETMADLGRRLEDLVSAERAPEGGRRQDTEGGDKGRCGSGRWKIRIFHLIFWGLALYILSPLIIRLVPPLVHDPVVTVRSWYWTVIGWGGSSYFYLSLALCPPKTPSKFL